MQNDASVQAVEAARWGERFVRPLYDTFGFAAIPRLIPTLFGADADPALARRLLGPLAGSYDTVVLLFVDAFGWRFFEAYHERYPFLTRFLREGVVTKLTSQFPSTTTAHLTTIHTGLQVCQSGLYEWYQYEPALDTLITPLPYSFATDTERNTLAGSPLDPRTLYPRTTLYQALRRHGIRSICFQHRDFLPSPFSDAVYDGAEVVPHGRLRDALPVLVEVTRAAGGPAYVFLYVAAIDSAGHDAGPDSTPFRAAVDACFRQLESVLHRGLAGTTRRTLLLLTADHGQVAMDPDRTIFVDRTLPQVETWVRRSARGAPLAPAGSSRDLFLHVREEYLDEARDRLREHLAGQAEVHRTRDLIAEGLFGSAAPSPAFLERVGDLVVLPYAGESVWWHGGREPRRFLGHHGGLTPEEAQTPLLALAYGG